MEDIVFHYDGQLALINLFILSMLIIVYRKAFCAYHTKHSAYTFLAIFVLLNSTFAFSVADTYHYEFYYNLILKQHQAVHVEPFYYYVAELIPFNYYLWRLVIWGGAFFLYLRCAKHFDIDARGFGLLFSLILLFHFALTRGVLGISLFLISWTWILDNKAKNRWLTLLFSLVGIICSYFLHKSLPLFLLMALFAYIPLSRKHYVLAIIFYPLICVGFSFIMDSVINSGLLGIKSQYLLEGYMGKEKLDLNIKGYIVRILTYIPYFIVFYVLINYFTDKKNIISYKSKIFFQYSFILFYIALIFEVQPVSSFMSSRTLHMMCFPLTIVLSEFVKKQNKYPKKLKFALFLFALVAFYTVTYFIYKWW